MKNRFYPGDLPAHKNRIIFTRDYIHIHMGYRLDFRDACLKITKIARCHDKTRVLENTMYI